MITLDVPNEEHFQIKQLQLEKEIAGEKATLKEVYYEVIKKGIEAIKQEKPAK